MDLDFVLSLISDGPAKSFAYRRLQYLAGKWQMHTLLNEFQEMMDMKVRLCFGLPNESPPLILIPESATSVRNVSVYTCFRPLPSIAEIFTTFVKSIHTSTTLAA